MNELSNDSMHIKNKVIKKIKYKMQQLDELQVYDKVSVIGMSYIPEHLENDTEVPVLDISYDITDIENGNTFMTVMKSIPQEAMDWTYIAKPYVKLKDGTTIWGNSKTFGLDFITTLITWEE